MKQKFIVNIDQEVAKEAEEVVKSLGLSLDDAISIFLKAVMRENGIPFKVQIAPLLRGESAHTSTPSPRYEIWATVAKCVSRPGCGPILLCEKNGETSQPCLIAAVNDIQSLYKIFKSKLEEQEIDIIKAKEGECIDVYFWVDTQEPFKQDKVVGHSSLDGLNNLE